jgi:hypothetical protein
MPDPYDKTFEDVEWNRHVNSKTAKAVVMGGIIISFSVLFIGEVLKGTKNIITKPLYRKKKNVRSSSDLC